MRLKQLTGKFFNRADLNGSGQLTLGTEYSAMDWQQVFNSLCKPRNLCIAGGFLPLAWILIDIGMNNMGANPIQALHIRLGDWSLRFLCVTLLITPIQKMTRWQGMPPYRQLFGLFSFFYATLHLTAYLWLDHAFRWPIILVDIMESSYLWFGLTAYIVLFLLAITSSKAAKKIMGKNWKKLHRYIYLAVIAVVIHYLWQLKGNLLEPVFYGTVVFILLFFRVLVWLRGRYISRLMIPKRRGIDDN